MRNAIAAPLAPSAIVSVTEARQAMRGTQRGLGCRELALIPDSGLLPSLYVMHVSFPDGESRRAKERERRERMTSAKSQIRSFSAYYNYPAPVVDAVTTCSAHWEPQSARINWLRSLILIIEAASARV